MQQTKCSKRTYEKFIVLCKNQQVSKQLIVIGGGAAGFFCAVNAARMNPSLKVTIVEKTGKLLSKVKVSGGGRCNVTHACFDIVEMSKRYPRGGNFVKKTFHQFFTTDTVQWFEERGVKLKAEEDGRMFPVTDSSQTIIDCLLREVNKYGVEIMLNAANINLVAFSHYLESMAGQLVALFVIAIAAGEAAIGLAIIIVVFRGKISTNVDEMNLFKW